MFICSMARLAIGNWQRERTKRECQSFVIVSGRARLQTSHRKDPEQNVCHRFEGGKGEAERLHARGTCLAATTRADTEDAQRFATDRAYAHDDMNFGRTCKRFLALGRPRRARFAASPTAHLPHPRFLAAREDEQNGDGLELGALPGAQFAGNVCHNHLTLRSHYHTTASRDNVLVYTVAGAVAVVAGGYAMDKAEKVMENRKKEQTCRTRPAAVLYKGAFEPEMTKRGRR